jgi:hypothetical protein
VIVLVLLTTACTGGRSPAPSVRERPSTTGSARVDRGGSTIGLAIHPGSSLSAIDGASQTEIWAVGEWHSTARQHSLAAQWDGSSWRLVPVPDVGPLWGLDVSGPDDAWAIGGHSLLHWNGAAWSVTALPRGNYTSVSARGPGDVWVAGVQPGPMIGRNSQGWSSAVAHYDGASWTVMQTPNPGTRDNYVEGIVALSSTDVWAAGYFDDLGKHTAEATSLTMHWDGKAWSLIRSPNPSPSLNVIWSMGRDDTGGVWTLGQYEGSDHHLHPLMLRWNGRSWVSVRLRGDSFWSAQAVASASTGPVWVVGSPSTSSFAIARCAETSCRTSAQPTDFDKSASSVYSAAADDAWIVGVIWGDRSRPLVEHWDGEAWSSAPFPEVPK